jgi:5-methylthioribose kinase
LLHTDLHADQFLVSDKQVRVIDWAFPGAGAAWVDAAFLVIRLILAGQQISEAEAWAHDLRCWADAPAQAVTAFAAYVAGMWSCWAVTDPQPDAVRRAAAAREYAAWRARGSSSGGLLT